MAQVPLLKQQNQSKVKEDLITVFWNTDQQQIYRQTDMDGWHIFLIGSKYSSVWFYWFLQEN